MIERSGIRNLVKEYGVESTRTKLYRRYETGSKFADYIFVSPEVKVNDFKVLPDEVSDHSPLMLDFDL
jgi:endonuclease/exonuclease/phosphatase family metal-dependent hydrolase